MARKFTGGATSELKVRVPKAVHDEIRRSAKLFDRSVSAEVNERLIRSLSGMLEETLMLVYGPDMAQPLIGAYRQGKLKAPSDKELEIWWRRFREWTTQVQTALED
jgi:hypothetical protein